jgi:hypothetical protein
VVDAWPQQPHRRAAFVEVFRLTVLEASRNDELCPGWATISYEWHDFQQDVCSDSVNPLALSCDSLLPSHSGRFPDFSLRRNRSFRRSSNWFLHILRESNVRQAFPGRSVPSLSPLRRAVRSSTILSKRYPAQFRKDLHSRLLNRFESDAGPRVGQYTEHFKPTLKYPRGDPALA